MRKIGLLIVISCLIFSCSEKKQTSSFDYYDENMILSFYNEVIDTIIGENVLIEQPSFGLTLFSLREIEEYKNDSVCLKNHKIKFSEFLWSTDNVVSQDTIDSFFEIKNNKIAWENFRKEYGNVCFFQVGLPSFTPDLMTAYLSIDKYCGRLSGYGMNYIFVKENGKWILKFKEETWVS